MKLGTDGLAGNPQSPSSQVCTTAAEQWRASLRLAGQLDAAVAPRLRAELDRHLDAGRRLIRIDLGQVGFIDSTTLGELLRASQWCQREHGALILTSVPAPIARLISLSGLDSVLLIDRATSDSSDHT